jgi:hypothetical protein
MVKGTAGNNNGRSKKAVDGAAFEKVCEPFYSQFPEWSPGLYDRVKKALAE